MNIKKINFIKIYKFFKRKNEAIQERVNVINSGWIENEMDKIFKIFLKLMQTEINKLHETIVFISNIEAHLLDKNIIENLSSLLIDPFDKDKVFNIPIYN